MSPKRPPVPLARQVATEWDPSDTQTLERRVHLAHETDWRNSTVDQFKELGKTLAETRDLARTTAAALEVKASSAQLAELAGAIKVLTERVATLKHVTWGVLVVFVVAILLEKKGVL